MNPDTGKLIRMRTEENFPSGFEEVPRDLYLLARAKFERLVTAEEHGPQEAQVNLRSKHPLALWAKKKRIAKIAEKSRRRNRR